MAQATTRDDDFIDICKRHKEAEREAELTDPAQPYMRNAHLLPPRDEHESVDEYVRLLERFARVPATEVSFFRFNPTLAQRRANANALAEWQAALRKSRRTAGSATLAAYVQATLDGCAEDIAAAPIGAGNHEINRKAYKLGAYVNVGLLTRDGAIDALLAATRTWANKANESACLASIDSGLNSAKEHGITPRLPDGVVDDAHHRY
jgi:hypothetical protein